MPQAKPAVSSLGGPAEASCPLSHAWHCHSAPKGCLWQLGAAGHGDAGAVGCSAAGSTASPECSRCLSSHHTQDSYLCEGAEMESASSFFLTDREWRSGRSRSPCLRLQYQKCAFCTLQYLKCALNPWNVSFRNKPGHFNLPVTRCNFSSI